MRQCLRSETIRRRRKRHSSFRRHPSGRASHRTSLRSSVVDESTFETNRCFVFRPLRVASLSQFAASQMRRQIPSLVFWVVAFCVLPSIEVLQTSTMMTVFRDAVFQFLIDTFDATFHPSVIRDVFWPDFGVVVVAAVVVVEKIV
jgi:hypothetical protein